MAIGQITANAERDAATSAFWRQVLDPTGIGLATAIAVDIASFTGETVAAVLNKMESGKNDLKELWEKSGIDANAPDSVAAFYRDQFVEAYELADWHCGRTTNTLPLNYPNAALFARHLGLRRALDFGSGIGSGSLCLAAAGCEVHAADVASTLLQFVGHRLTARGYSAKLIDLNTKDRPQREYYDIILCFDVLEHIPDQCGKLLEIQSYLRPGGYLFVNLMDDSFHPDRPMHVSSAGNWLRLVRQTSLWPAWEHFYSTSQVLVRRPGGRLLNWAAAWKDKAQGY